MAYAVMSTQVSGYTVLFSDWNEIVNNFKLTLPGLVTTDGDMVAATGSNATKRVPAMGSGDTLIHEAGGLEFDANAVTTGDTIVGQSAGVFGLETAMSQAQAEAGSDTQVRGATAQRLSQAIAAITATGFSSVGFARICVFNVGP